MYYFTCNKTINQHLVGNTLKTKMTSISSITNHKHQTRYIRIKMLIFARVYCKTICLIIIKYLIGFLYGFFDLNLSQTVLFIYLDPFQSLSQTHISHKQLHFLLQPQAAYGSMNFQYAKLRSSCLFNPLSA